jgi:hypothetical protein
VRRFRAAATSIVVATSLVLTAVSGSTASADDGDIGAPPETVVTTQDEPQDDPQGEIGEAPAFPSIPIPQLPASVVAGLPTTADAGTWPEGTTLGYVFTVDGIAAPEQESATFTFSPDDAGRSVGVTVIARHPDYAEAKVDSEARILTGTLELTRGASVVGAIQVGTALSAEGGVTAPEATSVTYSWKIDGVEVSASSTFTPRPADLGKKITLEITALRDGFISLTTSTTPVAIAKGVFTSAPKPTIAGSAKVGSVLKASPGTWSPSAKFTYRWLRNGTAIRGATGSTYKLTAADWKKRITVEVTAVSTGYGTAKAVSAASASVVKAFAKTSRPRITGTVRVGSTVSASLSAWSPSATFTYQWKRNGVAIPGATARTYRLTGSDYNKAITVTVTGRATGYATTSSTSTATAKAAAPAPSITRAGTYRVGSGIAAGTYFASAKPGCYWERRSSAGTSLSGIIANDFRGDAGRVIVKISSSDRFFVTNAQCGRWTKLVGSMTTTAGNGTYAVNMHLAPGLYFAPSAQYGCYWEIVSGFGGTFDEVIENDFVTWAGPQYVRIYSDDKGFTSLGCGTWKRISD